MDYISLSIVDFLYNVLSYSCSVIRVDVSLGAPFVSSQAEAQQPNKRLGMFRDTSEDRGKAQPTKMVSSYGSESGPTASAEGYSSNDFHNYNAPDLPDTLPDTMAEDNKDSNVESEKKII